MTTKNFVECAFVNDENPIKEGEIKGYKVTKNEDNSLSFHVVREIHYQHPECSKAILTVNRSFEKFSVREGQQAYSRLYLLFMAQESVKEIAIG